MILCFAILSVPCAFIIWVIWMDAAHMLRERRAAVITHAAIAKATGEQP